MTTNKPEVVAYRYTASRSFGKRNPKWHYQESFPHAENRKVEEIGRLEKLIRLSDYEALQAECEQLRKDADRYRWLRRGGNDDIGVVMGFDGIDCGSASVAYTYEEGLCGERMDAAIDAAMQGDQP